MEFGYSERTAALRASLEEFLNERVIPSEPGYYGEMGSSPDPHVVPQIVEDLKTEARARGLWNLFLPSVSGLSNAEYAPLAEVMGWSHDLLPEACNCQAPDTGNMEVLHLFGTPDQQQRWLEPLLAGEIRSAFVMTEPDVASSDATNIECRIERDGDGYVLNGHKWWASGALDPRCRILLVMGKTDPEGPRHRQQSIVLVPIDTPGVNVVRSTRVFGFEDRGGHAEITLADVRVPAGHLLGSEGDGFSIAQARLGPGRIHHCMRAIGAAERALSLMVARARSRHAFGRPLADQGVVRQQIAESRLEIEQARLLTLKTAWLIDQYGADGARAEIAAIKVAVPRMAVSVIDRAIQIHGGAGVSEDTPLSRMWAWHRAMRIFDGPDEVHLRTLAKTELIRDDVANSS